MTKYRQLLTTTCKDIDETHFFDLITSIPVCRYHMMYFEAKQPKLGLPGFILTPPMVR